MLQEKSEIAATKGSSRRRFLAGLGIGAAAVTALSAGLLGWGRKPDKAAARDFPGPDSIFHPAQDPRTDDRRQG